MVQYPFCALVGAGGNWRVVTHECRRVEQVVKVTVQAARAECLLWREPLYRSIGREMASRVEKAGAECLLVPTALFTRIRRSLGFDYTITTGYRRSIALPMMVYSRDGPCYTRTSKWLRLAQPRTSTPTLKDGPVTSEISKMMVQTATLHVDSGDALG